jgi:hypothetical protein
LAALHQRVFITIAGPQAHFDRPGGLPHKLPCERQLAHDLAQFVLRENIQAVTGLVQHQRTAPVR